MSGDASETCEALFRSVVEGSLQGVIIQQDGRIVYANSAMARLFGYDRPDDLLGLSPFEDLISDADLDLFRARTAAVYRGEAVAPSPVWRARHRHGKTVWITSSAQSSQWLGRPSVASFYFDITDLKLAQSALQVSEMRYSSALRAGRMGAWETDFVTGVRTWTEEGQELFGLNVPDGIGKVGGDGDEYVAVLHPDDRHLVARYRALADTQESFPAEHRIIKPDGSMVWLSGRGQVVSRQPDGRAHRLISIMADVTERKAIELQNQFLLREMTHRSKNLLAVIQAIARQTATSARGIADFQERFGTRLQGLAASHDLLTRERWLGAPLAELIREQLGVFLEPGSPRLDIRGSDMMIAAGAVQSLGLAIHELATNAVKHGALSVEQGIVEVRWTVNCKVPGSSTLSLSWVERGGPQVAPPTRKGFGRIVIDEMIASALGGLVELDFRPTGLTWVASIPLGNVCFASAREQRA